MEPVSIAYIVFCIMFLSLIPLAAILELVVDHLENVEVEFVEDIFMKDRGQDVKTLWKESNEDKALSSTFEREYIDLIKRLCKQYASKRTLFFLKNRFEPMEQTNYIGFKKGLFGHLIKPFKAEMVRCNKKYAFIEAGNQKFAYLLKIGKLAKDSGKIDREIFRLVLRFPYMEKISKMEDFEAIKKIIDEKARESENLYMKEQEEEEEYEENHTQSSNLKHRQSYNHSKYGY